jgi:hypothetical protein
MSELLKIQGIHKRMVRFQKCVVDGAGFLYKKYAVFPRSLFINFPVIYTGSREIVKLPHVQVRLYVEPRSGSGEKLAGDAPVGCGRRRGGQRWSARVM